MLIYNRVFYVHFGTLKHNFGGNESEYKKCLNCKLILFLYRFLICENRLPPMQSIDKEFQNLRNKCCPIVLLEDCVVQDCNYLFTNCMELTVELSCEKRPPAYSLSTEWRNNRYTVIEEGFIEKRRQRSSLLFGGQNYSTPCRASCFAPG